MKDNKNTVYTLLNTNRAAVKYIAQANGLNPQDLKNEWVPVVDVENKKIYLSVTEAALAAGITAATIVRRCNKNNSEWQFASTVNNKILKECATTAMAIMKSEIGKASGHGYSYTYKKGVTVKEKKLRVDPVNKYRSATPETSKYQDAERYALCEQIFANDTPLDWSKGTMILDNGKLSPVETHFTRPNNNIASDITRLRAYQRECKAIRKSCNNYSRIICNIKPNRTMPLYNGMRFIYLSELPTEILKSILKEMKENNCKDYIAYNKYKEKHPTNYSIVIGRISKQKTTYSKAEATMMLNEIARLEKLTKELYDKLGKSKRY